MQKQPNQNAPPFQSAANALGLALFVARTWATSLEVFLHRGVGERYMGWPALAVLLLVPFYTMAWQGRDIRWIALFMPAYLLMCLITRIEIIARRLRGETCHSFYTGWPRFLGPKAKVTELNMKRFWEPFFVLLWGWVIREYCDAPLGTYFMIGAGCLFITVHTSDMAERLRSLDLHDATIDQEMIAERFREMRGDRW